MQFRRLAFALALLAALGALVWFAFRGDGASGAGLAAPAPRSGEATENAPATELERAAVDSTRVAEKPHAQGVDPQSSTRPAISAESTESADGSGLLVRVLDADAKPLSGATLYYVIRGTGPFSVYMPHPTDESGSERLHAAPGRTFDIRASDPQGRYGPAYAFVVPSEQRTLDLVLERTTPHTLLVVDEQGNPVEEFAWRMLDERQYRSPRTGLLPHDEFGHACDSMLGDGTEGAYLPQPDQHAAHPEGRVALRCGSLRFVLQVDAEDFAPAQAGPFAPEGAPSEIRLELERLPGIHGRVVHAGAGVAGAWVRLLAPETSSERTLLDGFPTRFRYPAEAAAECSADGSFVLPLRSSGIFVVQAGAAGLCAIESDPRHYSEHQGASDIELTLPEPGSIEGRILLPSDSAPREWIIGAAQCNGLLQSVHARADGRFQLEGLSPGGWLLHARVQDVASCGVSSISSAQAEELGPLSYTCSVESGRKTQVEIDLRQKATLAGELRLPGWEHATGQAWLSPLGSTFSRAASCKVTGPTLFQLEADQPGEYKFAVGLEDSQTHASLWFSEKLQLAAGETRWKAEYPVGELIVVNMLDAPTSAYLTCEFANSRRADFSVALGPHEERKLSGLPLGTWKRMRHTDAGTIEDARVEIGSAAPARLEWN